MFFFAALWVSVLPNFFVGADDSFFDASYLFVLYCMYFLVLLSVLTVVVVAFNRYWLAGFVHKPRASRRCESVNRTRLITALTPPRQSDQVMVRAMEQGSLGLEDEATSFLLSHDADTLVEGSDELALLLSDTLVDVGSYWGTQILDEHLVSSPRFSMVLNEMLVNTAYTPDSYNGRAVHSNVEDSLRYVSPQSPHFASTPVHGQISLDLFVLSEPTSPIGNERPVTPGSLTPWCNGRTFCKPLVTRKCARRLFEEN